jgi:release factor glutamine methyltransferase
MFTVLEIIKKTTEFFAGKGIDSPRLNAELLVGHALERKRMQLYLEFERPLTDTELDKIRPLVRRRGQLEPIQYIIGETDFFGLKLRVDRRALIPRPETEQLVEHVVALRASAAPARILDLGTGSGAIALALAQAFPTAAVTATDKSADALALAAENAATTALQDRVTFLRSDWFDALPPDPFDIVVSNPPYLTADETAETPAEVRGYEPREALTAGADGLGDLLKIISRAPAFLMTGGLLALETGVSHHERLMSHAQSAGFSRVESKQDLTRRDRFILATL